MDTNGNETVTGGMEGSTTGTYRTINHVYHDSLPKIESQGITQLSSTLTVANWCTT